jgi:hypothetical protein
VGGLGGLIRSVAHETSAEIDRRVELYRTLVALAMRLDRSQTNRPFSPDGVALTH